MTRLPKYIIYAPSYHEDNGGSIYMHQLAATLCEMGERAMLWPMPPLERPSLREQTRQLIRKPNFNRLLFRKPDFNRLPGGNTPIATVDDLDDDTIVIYPEIILGNPLDATNVARWLLYKPGLLHPFEFGPDEMFFKASDFSDDVSVTGGAQLLYVPSINSCYRDHGNLNRQGSCYMIRKGKGISLIHNLEGSHNIDELTHEETAKAFNESEFFYCYDEATMYSQYAAICGCISIVIPVHYQCRDDWVRDRPIARYGVAYGMEDIEHARATRHQLLDYLVERKRSSLETVATFVTATKEHFNFPNS